MPRTDSMDLISQALFDSSIELSEGDQALLARLRDAYTYWLEKPTLSDTRMRDYLMVNHHVSKSQAYNDIAQIKLVLGNIPVATKEFYRYKANFILDEAHNAAMAGNDRKAKALTKIAEAIAYNNRTNEDDGEKLPFDKIVPTDLSFSINPEDAGVKSVPGVREKALRLFAKYAEEIELDTSCYNEEDIPE